MHHFLADLHLFVLVHEGFADVGIVAVAPRAVPRIKADQYEMVFSFNVSERSLPEASIGAAAPIALTGVM